MSKNTQQQRLYREEKTLRAMFFIYCRNHHKKENGHLCGSCNTTLQYALKRLYACPFQENKPTCANCSIHCYSKDMQDIIRKVMRYSGPRLTYSHPILAICHLLDGRIKPRVLKSYKPENND